MAASGGIKERATRGPRPKALAFPVITHSAKTADLTSAAIPAQVPLPELNSEQEAANGEENNPEQIQAATQAAAKQTEFHKLHFKGLKELYFAVQTYGP